MITKQSPLAGVHTGSAETVAIRELPGLPMIDLRVAPGTASYKAVIDALHIDLPLKTGATVAVSPDGEAHALCLGPDWWLIVGDKDAELKLTTLRSNEEYHVSVVDVSGQRTTIELEGPHARDVLAHVWEQDLRDRSFPVGSVSQGLIAKAPVIVFHVAPSTYRLMVRSSFAVHAWKAVVDAAEEAIV